LDEVSKIVLTPKKKDQNADTKRPSEICKFLPYPSEILQKKYQRMPTGLAPQKRFWSHPSDKFTHGGGGGHLIGMAQTGLEIVSQHMLYSI
jgi:hypothetical protein